MMKRMRKLASLLLALTMVFAMATTAFAADTGTITINNAQNGNTYKVYKVFDAVGNGTSIAYTLVDGKTTAPAGFIIDGAGNVKYTGSGTNGQLTDTDIAAIAAYVTEGDLVGDPVVANGDTVTISNLANGYYYITTTTGTAVTITSTNPNAQVNDKNNPPELEKKITSVDYGSLDDDGKKALAEVGSKVTYTATIEVKSGAENYVFHDKMDSTLSYNNDVAVKLGNDTIAAGASTFTVDATGTDTIIITFNNDWIKAQVDKTITITYSATVTSDALSMTPGKNTATVDYGHNTETNSTPEKSTVTYNAKFTVTKTDDNNQALAGAGFVIAKTAGTGETAKTVYYQKSGNDINWVEDIDQATELTTTTESNVVTFTGLADGTYTLIEKTVPAGYNKAEDKTFTIAAHDYTTTNLEQATTVVNNAGALLPSTGGIGTTIFYVLGSILVIGAAVLLITKKRMGNNT